MMKRSPPTVIFAAALFACLVRVFSPSFAAEPEPALTGRLLDAEGKPVVIGFVMLKEHPRCWNWTDGKGEFRIPVEAGQLPATLLASFAGHDPAEVAVKETGNMPDIRLKLQDPELTKLETGCAIQIGRKRTGLWGFTGKRELLAAEEECLAAWEAFLKERGSALCEKIVAGQALNEDERRYRFMLYAYLAREAGPELFAQFGRREPKGEQEELLADLFNKQGSLPLKKGLRQEPLSAVDVESLRVFRAMQGAAMPNFTHLHLAGQTKTSLKLGQKLPDVTFADSLALLSSDRYSNYEALGLTEFLRPEGLAYFLSIFDTYTLKGGRPVPAPAEQLKRRYHHEYERFVGVQDMLKSGRPVLLNWAWFEDTTHTSLNMLFAEYIKRAYAGQVDVYHINEASPDWFDTIIPERMYFGPNPAADASKGLLGQLGEEDMTPMERTARMTKMECMRHLMISPPVLQQPPGEPWHAVNAWSTITLLDRQGISMAPGNKAEGANRVTWNIGWSGWATFFEVSGVHMGATTERALRAALANGGNRVPDLPMPLPDYPRTQTIDGHHFRVVSVDRANRLVTAERQALDAKRNKEPVGEWVAGETYRFKLRPDARIEFRTKEQERREANGLKGLEALEPGTTFRARIAHGMKMEKLKDYREKVKKGEGLQPLNIQEFKDREIDTVRIFLSSGRETQIGGNLRFHVAVYGRITANNNGRLTVQVDRDYVNQLLGLRFWKEHLAKGDASLEDGEQDQILDYNLRERLAVLQRWADGTEADRTCTFQLDSSVATCRNGIVDVEPGAFAAGDYVWIMYELYWEREGHQREAILPETIMAAEPMKDNR